MKKISIIVLIAATALALSACGPSPVPQLPMPQTQVAEQQAPVQEGYSGSQVAVGALAGAAAGYMLGKHSGRKENTVVVHPAPSYSGGYSGRKTVTTTTTRRSAFGGKTVTRTVTRHR